MRMTRLCRRWAAAAILLVLWTPLSFGQQLRFVLDPAKTTISYTLSATAHTVHGTFKAKSGELDFAPSGEANGIFIVDATTGESGNPSRDHKMHQVVLESQKYPDIAFVPRKIVGNISPHGQSSFQMEGTFRLHGSDHVITVPITTAISGRDVTAKANFIIPYVEWGLKNPSTFLLHVSKQAEIDVIAQGTIQE